LGGWIFAGPKTIREVFVNYDKEKNSFRTYKNGDTVWLYGKITDIKYYNTTYGNYSLLTFDDTPKINDAVAGVFVRSKSSYHVGNYQSITLHFMKYHYNNDTFIAAEELFTPLYSYPFSIEEVIKGVGWVGGIVLVPMPTVSSMEYTIYLTTDPQQTGYPLNLFSLTLTKGSHYGGQDVRDLQSPSAVSGNYPGKSLDQNENLSGPSLNGIVEFKDVINPGMMDIGDKIVIKLPPTMTKYRFDSYLLSFNAGKGLIHGALYFVNGYLGVLEYPSGLLQNHVHLSLVNETKVDNGMAVFRVNEVPGVFAPYQHKIDWYILSYEYDGLPVCRDSSGQSPVLKEGLLCEGWESSDHDKVEYRDKNHNGIVDSTDEIIINWEEYKPREIRIQLLDNERTTIGSISWIKGLGVISGWKEIVEYNVARTTFNNVSINITSIYGYPGVRLTKIGDGKQFIALLFKNESLIINSTILNGTIDNKNDTELNFVDIDANGYLNVGDRFIVSCRPNTHYRLQLVNYNHPHFTSNVITWQT
jgi:hypothetical protein